MYEGGLYIPTLLNYIPTLLNYILTVRIPSRLLPPLAFIHNIAVDLREDSGWVVVGSRAPPSPTDFLRVLSSLSSLWIRGGFYDGVCVRERE